ncbi:MAG TPA: stage II sporulation protein M, partial [Candidatus Binatus sp.]|nr:stage II sporulation protein M [Candidatus Binatus sp.]
RKLPRLGWRKVKTGLREIGGFLLDPTNIPYHLASIGAFILGVALGNYVTNNGLLAALSQLGLLHPGRGNPNVDISRVIPPFLGVDLFFHNWLVSIGTAMAGIGFGFPSFADILFNGFILGYLQPTIPNDALFFSAILPHGIIEIPSLILAGSVGIKLGVGAWKMRLNPTPENTEGLSRNLREAVYVVIGLALMFLIAGLIEADITPWIMRLYGWTF